MPAFLALGQEIQQGRRREQGGGGRERRGGKAGEHTHTHRGWRGKGMGAEPSLGVQVPDNKEIEMTRSLNNRVLCECVCEREGGLAGPETCAIEGVRRVWW